MKKIILSAVAALTVAGAMAQTPFKEGDRKVDLTIGVGVVPYADKTRTTFDQHLSMEWGVATFCDCFTLGVGFAINNQYGAQFDNEIYGQYNYAYTYREWGMRDGGTVNITREETRQGEGWADAKVARDDINLMATCSMHYSPMDKLDTYVKVGVGAGVMNYIVRDVRNSVGFGEEKIKNYIKEGGNDYHVEYSYNDLDHVKWEGLGHKAVPSIAAFIGATYSLTEHWGVDAQIGLIDANLKGKKSGYPNSYGVFAVGASYKF